VVYESSGPTANSRREHEGKIALEIDAAIKLQYLIDAGIAPLINVGITTFYDSPFGSPMLVPSEISLPLRPVFTHHAGNKRMRREKRLDPGELSLHCT
jgi:hypothetical protein